MEVSRVKLSSLPFLLNLGTPNTLVKQRFQASESKSHPRRMRLQTHLFGKKNENFDE